MSLISAETAADIPDLMPEDALESVSLYSRAADSSTAAVYASAVSWPRSRRKPMSAQTIAMMGGNAEQVWINWQLYVTSQTVYPKYGDKIVDADGVTWHVKKSDTKQFRKVWTCFCVREAS